MILAIPCSTLREIEIETSLFPKDQLEVIHSLPYGQVARVLLQIEGKEEKRGFAYGPDFGAFLIKGKPSFLSLFFVGEICSEEEKFKRRVIESTKELRKLFPSLKVVGRPIFVNWSLEKYSKGSYSHFGLGQFEKFSQKTRAFGEEIKQVFCPVGDKIFFAGEHTALSAYGTLEGAVESGNRAFRMLERVLIS